MSKLYTILLFLVIAVYCNDTHDAQHTQQQQQQQDKIKAKDKVMKSSIGRLFEKLGNDIFNTLNKEKQEEEEEESKVSASSFLNSMGYKIFKKAMGWDKQSQTQERTEKLITELIDFHSLVKSSEKSEFKREKTEQSKETCSDPLAANVRSKNKREVSSSSRETKYFGFFPKYAATLTFVDGKNKAHIEDLTFSMDITTVKIDDSTVDCIFDLTRKTYGIESYLLTTLSNHHFQLFAFDGKITKRFAGLTAIEMEGIQLAGISMYHFNESLVDTFSDLLHTGYLFLSYFSDFFYPISERENILFLKQMLNFTLVERNYPGITIDESDISAGDVFAILKLDGVEGLIGAVSGTRVGHIEIAVKNGSTILICEAQNTAPYWPRPNWQCNKFSDWVQWIQDANYNIVHLRIGEPYKSDFNSTKAMEYLAPHLEKTPYGYQSFFYAAIDTLEDNWFSDLTSKEIELFWYFMEVLSPEFQEIAAGSALKQRMGIYDPFNITSRAQIHLEILRRNLTFAKVYVIPENDDWRYDKDQYPARVCSSFAAEVLKQSGAFDKYPWGNQFNATEFGPVDITKLQIYDGNATTLPPRCKVADPMLPYCQVYGKFRIDLGPTFNNFAPHAHMAETCPSKYPDFARPADC